MQRSNLVTTHPRGGVACAAAFILSCSPLTLAFECSFETGKPGGRPPDFHVWAPNEGEGVGRCELATDRARTRRQSLRLEVPAGGYIVASRYVPVSEGRNYLLRVLVSLDEGTTAGANMTIYWGDGPTQAKRLKTRHPSSQVTRKTGEWHEIKLVAVAPPGATHADVVLRLSGRARGWSGVAHFDDVALTQIADDLTLGPNGALVPRITVPNASFDAGGPDGLENWRLETENGDYVATQEKEGDNAVARLSFRKRQARRCRGSLVSDPVRVGRPCGHYSIRGRVRGRNAMCRLLVHVHDASTDEKLNFWAQRIPAPGKWRTIGGTMRVLPRFRDRELAFRVELRLPGSGEAWLDDIQIAAAAKPDVYWKRDAQYRWNPNSPLLTPREPANGCVAKVNPPSFVFPPVMRASAYRVEIGPTSDLDRDVIVSSAHSNSCYLHTATLDASKTWYWRSAALDEENKAIHASETWSFRIAQDAVEWAFPPMSALAEEVGPHPRLYVNAETLPEDRKRVLASADWPAYYATVERMLQAELKPEPVDYWDFDPWGEVYRHVYSPSGHLRRVYTNCAFVYLMTGEQRFLDKAKQFMLAQAAWDPEGPTCFQWLDQVGRSIMLDMSIAYDWLHNALTPEERKTIEESLRARIRTTYGTQRGYDCLRLRYYPRNSHGITILGMMCTTSLALLGDLPEAREIFEFVVPYYCAMFPPWGGDDGGWSEGVKYALWSVSGHMQRWETIRSAAGVDLFKKPWYANAPWWRLYCLPPFVRTSWFGDGHPAPPGSGDAALMEAFASIYGNSYFKWHAGSLLGGEPSPSWQSLLRARPVSPKPPVDVAQSRAFYDVGWAFLHSDLSDPNEVLLGFKSSPHGSYSHSHADQNSFVLYAYGKSMAIDAGYYESYGSPHHFRFTKQTKAHNAILVGGQGQSANDITSTGELTGFVHGAGFDYVSGQAAPAYKGAIESWERRILFVRPGLFIVIDDLSAAKPEVFEWLLHTAEEPRIDASAQRIRTTSDGSFLNAELLWPRGLRLTVTDEFDPQPLEGKIRPEKQYHITATAPKAAADARFVAVLAPCRAGATLPKLTLDRADDALVIKGSVADEKLLVIVPGAGQSATYGEVSTDAQLLALTERDDVVTRFCLVKGTACHRGGKPLLTCDAPSTASVFLGPDRTVIARDPKDTASIRVHVGPRPQELFLERSRKRRMTDVAYEAGIMALGAEPWVEAYRGAKPAQRQTVTLVCGDRSTKAEAILSWRDGYVLGANVPVPRGRYRVEVHASGKGKLTPPWTGQPQSVEAKTTVLRCPSMWLTSDTVHIAWDAGVKIGKVVFTSLMPAASVPALVRPEAAVKARGRIFWEAETVTAQKRGKAKPYTHRTFLSNGTGLGNWTDVGHSLTWHVTVPEAGVYALLLKGAVWEETGAKRMVAVDGVELNDGSPSHFAHTDGFGATPAEWRHFILGDSQLRPLPITLPAGRHTLALVNYGGGMNLDYLVLAPIESLPRP